MRRLILALTLALNAGIATAQDSVAVSETAEPALLVADNVEVTGQNVLIAKGNVEVFQGSQSVTASAIIYDRDAGTLTLEGPITLRDGADVLILASEAELDAGFRNGILRSARLVLDEQLQMAAVQINRVSGRYSQLYKTSITSCKVCEDGRPPLWQIRAKRVVHDQEEQQLYFDQAQLRVRNIPIFYVPRLRLPDPTLERATGFLIPSIRTTSQLATGVKVPYFIKLGDHRDLTLTPYLSAETRTLEYRYRQAFRTGRIEVNGAITDDTLLPDEDRYYLFAEGRFDLPRDFTLEFDLELVSDDSYLNTYAYGDKDRLDSEIAVTRTRRDEYIRAGLINFESLRAGESNATLPTVVADVIYERRLFPGALPGEIRVGLEAHSHYRSADGSVPGQNGRDVTRLNGSVFWRNDWTLPGGLRSDARIGFAFDIFDTRQDPVFAGQENRAFPQAAIAFRYPMLRKAPDGAVQFLEPVVQLAYTDGMAANVANDESTRVEFDEGNLFALSRFPEADRREHGGALAVGLNWARYDPDGWESYISLGQITRTDPIADFSATSGLRGETSHLLLAAQVKTQAGLALAGRFLFDNAFEFSKAELRGDWESETVTLGGSYLWLAMDPAEGRSKAVSEFTFDGDYRFDKHWRVSGNWRYDAEDDRTAQAGLGLGYDNECVSMDLTLERNFSSSTTVEPTTNFGFTISLRGFSAQTKTEKYIRSCS